MCAIFGSKNLKIFGRLYQQNLVRGEFAYGGVYLTKNTPIIVKKEGKETLAEKYNNSVLFYSGHTQAPTSSAQTYNTDTSHPFVFNDWIVSHNGVLTNHKQLRTQYNIIANTDNVVDSSIIPILLSKLTAAEALGELDVVIRVMSLLEGTHSTAIHNIQSGNFYITRCGSTLFKDYNGNYSSTSFEGSEIVSDGSIHKYTDNIFHQVGSFKPKSPFFI